MILFYKKKHNSVYIQFAFQDKPGKITWDYTCRLMSWSLDTFLVNFACKITKILEKQNLKGYYMYSIKWQSHSREKKFKRIWKFGEKKFISTCIVIIPFELYKYSSSYSSLIIKVSMFLIIVSATLLNSLNKTNTY